MSYLIHVIISLAKKLPPDVNVRGVFACNQLDLREIEVYGFDYDYTLACYKPAMGSTLFNLGKDILINKFKVSCLVYLLSLSSGLNDVFNVKYSTEVPLKIGPKSKILFRKVYPKGVLKQKYVLFFTFVLKLNQLY